MSAQKIKNTFKITSSGTLQFLDLKSQYRGLQVSLTVSADEIVTMTPVHLLTLWINVPAEGILVLIKPQFKEQLETQRIDVNSEQEVFSYQLPEIEDEDPETVTVQIEGIDDSTTRFEEGVLIFTAISESVSYNL